MSSGIQMVLAIKHPPRQPALPRLCKSSPYHRVGGVPAPVCTLKRGYACKHNAGNHEKSENTFTITQTRTHTQ